jgi:hypothetical protein
MVQGWCDVQHRRAAAGRNVTGWLKYKQEASNARYAYIRL